MTFVHLHTHSHYSIGRALPKVRDLVQRAAELGMPAIALTDNNSIAGLFELQTAAHDFHIQPILGCELDVLPSDHSVFQGRTHRITLLVENEHGYRNLVELITLTHQGSPDIPPCVRFAELERRAKGLIALTGSPRGELYHHLREGNPGTTKDYLNRLAAAFGRDNLFFEIIEYPHPRTRKIMDYVLELSRFLGVPAVATQNIHYLHPQDALPYTILVQQPRATAPVWPLPDSDMPTRHFTDPAEMRKRFYFTPEILDQTLTIAQRCTFNFPRMRPEAPVPDFERGQDASTLLWDRVIQGATERYTVLSDPVKERLNREYGDFRALKGEGIELCEHLLFLQDITRFIKTQELCHGAGKGKWITSVIAYALGIVDADPLAYGFEYQPLRSAPHAYPLFEIELSNHGAEELLKYLREKYHDAHLASIGRRVDWKTPDLYQHLCRWAGLSFVPLRDIPHSSATEGKPPVVKELKRSEWRHGAKSAPQSIPLSPAEEDAEPEEFSLHPDTDVESGGDATPGSLSWLQYDSIKTIREKNIRNHKTLAEAARALHPCPKGFEAQKGGWVLAKSPIHNLVPILTTPSRQRVTQAEAPLLDRLQMPRLQCSPSSMLNILELAQNCIREETDDRFLISSIPLDDESTWRILGLGITNGIPPFHSISSKSHLRAERPLNIRELLQLHIKSRRRRFGESANAGEFESRDDAARADAISDCILGYCAAYLKVHYPIAFMVSVLTHTVLTHKATGPQRPRFQILLREARKMQINILGPDINISKYAFTQESRGIRTGLMAVQGLGEQTFREIEKVRQGRAFTSLPDFCHRTDPRGVNHAQIVNLIKAGAFDSLIPDHNRNRLHHDFECALKNARLKSAAANRKPQHTGTRQPATPPPEQLQLFDTLVFDEEASDSIKRNEYVPEPKPHQIMKFEQEALGYTFTYDLYDHHRDMMQSMGAILPVEIQPKLEGKTVFTAGFIDHAEREGALIDDETEIVLDFEGKVVKIPHAAAESYNEIQHAQGLVLIEGVIRKQSPSEAYLVARRFHLFDEALRAAREAATLQINLTEFDSGAISAMRAALKKYKGPTAVEINGLGKATWWTLRGADKAKVLVCPPLLTALHEALADNQIKVLDKDGKKVMLPGTT